MKKTLMKIVAVMTMSMFAVMNYVYASPVQDRSDSTLGALVDIDGIKGWGSPTIISEKKWLNRISDTDTRVSAEFHKMIKVCIDIEGHGDAYSIHEYLTHNNVDRFALDKVLNECVELNKKMQSSTDEDFKQMTQYVFDTLHALLSQNIIKVFRQLDEFEQIKDLNVSYIKSGDEASVFALRDGDKIIEAFKLPSIGARGGKMRWNATVAKHERALRSKKIDIVNFNVYKNAAIGELYKNIFGEEYLNSVIVQRFLPKDSYEGYQTYLNKQSNEVETTVQFVEKCFEAVGNLFDEGYVFKDWENDTLIIEHEDQAIRVMDIGGLNRTLTAKALRDYATLLFEELVRADAGGDRDYYNKSSKGQQTRIEKAKKTLKTKVDSLSDNPAAYSSFMFNEVIDGMNDVEFRNNNDYEGNLISIAPLMWHDNAKMKDAIGAMVTDMNAAIDAGVLSADKVRRILAKNLRVYTYIPNDEEEKEVENTIATWLRKVMSEHAAEVRTIFKDINEDYENETIEALIDPDGVGTDAYAEMIKTNKGIDIRCIFVLTILASMGDDNIKREAENEKSVFEDKFATQRDILHYKSA
jgi:hypothetical protein